MTNAELYDYIGSRLKNAGIEEYVFESRCIIEDIMGLDRLSLAMNAEKTADEAKKDKALLLLEKRLNGEPLQYLLGEWEFFGLPFKVGKGVLIPRPDTEVLVETVLDHFLKSGNHAPEIIDLCSGSGCIAVALQKNLPRSKVTAVELSSEAFPYLTENIRRNGVDVKIMKGDVLNGGLLQNFSDPDDFGEFRKLDCVVSNPPYLTEKEMGELSPEVKFEPETALYGGTDGLKFYRVISCLWKEILKEGGLLAFEIGYEQGEAVSDILRKSGYTDIKVIKDLGGNDRVVTGINMNKKQIKI
ncbi:MAG: peptide chain release factor N(5)-glutamine methyltransferase [Oscillospiraceae bacterium]